MTSSSRASFAMFASLADTFDCRTHTPAWSDWFSVSEPELAVLPAIPACNAVLGNSRAMGTSFKFKIMKGDSNFINWIMDMSLLFLVKQDKIAILNFY